MADPLQQNQQPVFDVQGARTAGASDEDILNHLATSRGFDVQGALKAGAAKQDIIQHLSMQPARSSTPTAPSVPLAPNAGLAPAANSNVPAEMREVNSVTGTPNMFTADEEKVQEGKIRGVLRDYYKDDLMGRYQMGTVAPLAQGVQDLSSGTWKGAKKGVAEVGQGVGTGLSPLLIPALATNPAAVVGGLARAYAVGKVAKGVTSVSGGDEDAQNAAETIGNFAGGSKKLKDIFTGPSPKGAAPLDAEKAFGAIHPKNNSADTPSILSEIRNAAATEAAANQPQTGLGGVVAKVKSKVGINPQVEVPKGKAGVRAISDYTQKAVDAHEAEIAPIKQQFSNETVDNTSAGQAARSYITPEMRDAAAAGNGDANNQINSIEALAKRAEGANSVGNTDQLRHTWNDEVHALYEAPEAKQDVAPNILQAKKAALDALRGNFYNRLGELSGQDLSPLAKREGLLLEAKAAVTKSGNTALERGAQNDKTFMGRVLTGSDRDAGGVSSVAPAKASLLEVPFNILKAIKDPNFGTPVGDYTARVNRSLANLPAARSVSAPPFPGGKLPVQQPLPSTGLFGVQQTPVPPSQKGPALPFGEEDLLQPGAGSSSTKGVSGYAPNQPVAAHVTPQDRSAMEGAEYGGFKVGSDETPNYGQTRRPLVTEEHPEIDATPRGVTAITDSLQNGKKPLALPPGQYEGKESPLPAALQEIIQGLQKPLPPGIGPQGSHQMPASPLPIQDLLQQLQQPKKLLGPATPHQLPASPFSQVSGGSQGALPPALEGAINKGGDRRAFVRDAMNSAGITAQANGILQKAGLRIGQYNSELGTVSFEDPANQNRFAVMQASDLLKGGPEAARAAIAKVAKPAPPRAGVKK